MSRKRMYIPSDFTVAPNTVITFKGCVVYRHTGLEIMSVNLYKDSFQGNEVFEDWDIYTEDEPIVFLDKIEFYAGREKERLL